MARSGRDRTNLDLISEFAGAAAAAELLKRYPSLTALSRATIEQLQEVRGIGPSRASKLKSAFDLAVRLSRESLPDRPVLDSPSLVADYLREENRGEEQENLYVLLLDTRNRLIKHWWIGCGTIDSLLVHPREVFSRAIENRAHSLILCHNHPSGDPSPSEADIRVTRELIRAGKLLRINVIDHVILGHRTESRTTDYQSLRELGYFYD